MDWLDANKGTRDAKALMMMMMELCFLMQEFKPDFNRYDQRDMLVDFYQFAADQDGGVWGDSFERFFMVDQMIQRNVNIDSLEACFNKSQDLSR